jgi:hypothetical protein
METTTIVRNETADQAAGNAFTNLSLKATPDWVRTVTVTGVSLTKNLVFEKDGELIASGHPAVRIEFEYVNQRGELRKKTDNVLVKGHGDWKALAKVSMLAGIQQDFKEITAENLLDFLRSCVSILNRSHVNGGFRKLTMAQVMFAKGKPAEYKGKMFGLRKGYKYASVFLRQYTVQMTPRQAKHLTGLTDGTMKAELNMFTVTMFNGLAPRVVKVNIVDSTPTIHGVPVHVIVTQD